MKYRAWDTKHERWRDEFDWAVSPETGKPHWLQYGEFSWDFCDEADRLVLCRFTGAKDHSGLDLYENDIVNANDVPFVIKWNEDSYGWEVDFLNDSDRGGSDFEPWMLHQILSDDDTVVSFVCSLFEHQKNA